MNLVRKRLVYNLFFMKATLPLIASILIGCIPSCNRNTPTSENDKAYAMLEQTAAFNAAEQYDSAIAQGKKALALTGVADSTAGYLYAEISVSYSMKGNMKQSLAYGQKAMQYSQGNIDPESFAILCGNMGISYRRMGMNDSAAVCYQRGIQEALKSSSKEALAYLQNNLSVLYCEMGRHSESLNYARKAIQNASLADDTIEMLSGMANEGICYAYKQDLNKAAQLLSTVYTKADSLDFTPLKLKVINYLISVYRDLGNSQATDNYLKLGTQLAQNYPPGSIAAMGIYEARLNTEITRKQYSQALKTAELLEQNTQMLTMPQHKLLRLQATCLAALGHYAQAYHKETQANALEDSVNHAELKKQLSEFSIRFRTKEKELEISRLQQAQAVQQSWAAIIVALLVAIIAALMIVLIRFRQKRKMAAKQTEIDLSKRYIEGMEKERERFARELHDGACNELLAIGLTLRNDNAGIQQAITHVSKLREELRHLSHEMMPPSFQYAQINELLAYYIDTLLKPDTLHISFTAEGNDWKCISPNVAAQTYRITQEAIGNVVRHSQATHAEVQLTCHDGMFCLTITDNGIGTENSGRHNGGVQSMHERAESINAQFKWSSSHLGTKVELKTTYAIP